MPLHPDKPRMGICFDGLNKKSKSLATTRTLSPRRSIAGWCRLLIRHRIKLRWVLGGFKFTCMLFQKPHHAIQ